MCYLVNEEKLFMASIVLTVHITLFLWLLNTANI